MIFQLKLRSAKTTPKVQMSKPPLPYLNSVDNLLASLINVPNLNKLSNQRIISTNNLMRTSCNQKKIRLPKRKIARKKKMVFPYSTSPTRIFRLNLTKAQKITTQSIKILPHPPRQKRIIINLKLTFPTIILNTKPLKKKRKPGKY